MNLREAVAAVLSTQNTTPSRFLSAMRDLEAAYNAPEQPINLVIALEGGIVTGGRADVSGINVTVLDYDTEGADEDELVEIPQHRTDEDDEDVVDAYVTSFDVDLDPEWITSVLSAIANS